VSRRGWGGLGGLGLVTLTTLSMLAACGDNGPSPPNAAKTVLIMDEGFDLASAELQGKVIGAFTIACRASSASADASAPATEADGGPPFDEAKRLFMAGLAAVDDRCHLREGISAKADPLSAVARFRPRWNDMVRHEKTANQVFSKAEWDPLVAAIDDELETFDFHGTATAGTIAHANPGLRLALVERPLSSNASIEAEFKCLVQDELDRTAALLRDADVLAAYARAPDSTLSAELTETAARLEVGFVNQSFGPLARADLEAIQVSAGCTPIDARAYFSAVHDATVARLGVTGPSSEIFIQSAGNESLAIESGDDEMTCLPEDPTHVLVGSHDLAGALSEFSNFGACVDVFAPGERIIAPYAGGWYFPVQGTSFSAPLLAWRLSRLTPTPFDLAQAEALARSKRNLSPRDFPRDFFFAPGGLPAATGALTAAGGLRMPTATPRARRRVSRDDLAETLRPLMILRALDGR
jgi:subtilisin family serine protease